MVNRLHQWDAVRLSGNPTRSEEVNSLIRDVKKKEVRKQGKVSSARQALEKSEFDCAIGLLNGFGDNKRKYMVTLLQRICMWCGWSISLGLVAEKRQGYLLLSRGGVRNTTTTGVRLCGIEWI